MTARRAGILYVGGRFLRRHRLWALALLTTLLAAVGIERAFRAEGVASEAQRTAAEWELASADALAFVEELFQSPAMTRLGRSTRLEDLLEVGSQKVAGRFAARPLARARIHSMLGRAWFLVGSFERAESEFGAALELLRARSDVDPMVVAELTVKRALAQNVSGHGYEALADLRRALPVLIEHRDERPDIVVAGHTALVEALRTSEGPAAALTELRASYQEAVELLGPTHNLTVGIASQLAQFEQDFGDPGRAAALLEVSAQAGSTETSEYDAANAALLAGRLLDAEQIATDLHASQLSTLGESHPDTISSLELMGFVALARNEPGIAESRLREATELWRQRFGEDHERVRFAMRHLGEALLWEGRAEEVVELVEELRQRQRATGRPMAIEDADLDAVCATALLQLGRVDEAIERQQDVIREVEKLTGAANRRTYQARSRLAQLTAAAGQESKALEELTALHHEMTLLLGEAHPDTLDVQGVLAQLVDATGDSEQAEALLTTGLERALAVFGPAHRSAMIAMFNLASFLTAHGRTEDARAATLRYRERFQAIATDGSATVADREAFARWLMETLPPDERDWLAAFEILAADVAAEDASAQVLMTSAKAYFLSDDVETALALAERAAVLMPDDAPLRALVEDLREARQRVR